MTKTDAAGTTTYTWDAFERLVEAVVTTGSGTTTVTFAYDALGRRIAKTVVVTPTSGPVVTTTTTYVYDGEDIIWEEVTTDASGSPVTTTTRYVHGLGIDEPLLLEIGGQVLAVHADGLGSVTGLSDGSQTLVEERHYTAFGVMQRTGSWPGLAYAYTGREWEPELGVYYYRARYYDPEVGRFLSRDPIGFASGATNLYGYVQNGPINFVDPFGLGPEDYWRNQALAARDFWRNYWEMREANTMGADKYFHCKANCQSARRGMGGDVAAALISESRELIDEYVFRDSRQVCDEDRAANDLGRQGGMREPLRSCEEICAPLRPASLDLRY